MGIGLSDNSGDINGLGINTAHELKAALTQTSSAAGFAGMVAESSPTVGSAGDRYTIPLEATEDFRLRTANDALWFVDNARAAVLNTSIWTAPATTMTLTVASGIYVLNASSHLSANGYTNLTTRRTFPNQRKGFTTYAEFVASYTQIPTANTVMELGFFNSLTNAAPTDGVFFRINQGQFYGVISNTSVERYVDLGELPAPDVKTNFVVECSPTRVKYWVNNQLKGYLDIADTQIQLTSQDQLPINFRVYNTATPPAYGNALRVGNISVSSGGASDNRLWPTVMAGMGNGSYQVPSGGTAGQTTNMINASAIASATLTAGVATYPTLGGKFAFSSFASSEVDYHLFGYLVPVGKTLIVRGIRIDMWSSVLTGGATGSVFEWQVGVGSTGAVLAGTESTTAKIRRAMHLGIQAFGAAAPVGTVATPIDVNLDAPVVTHSGEYFSIIFRQPYGLLTAGQIFRGGVFINGYFE